MESKIRTERKFAKSSLVESLFHTFKKEISVKSALLNMDYQDEKTQLSLDFSSQNFRVRVFFFLTK